MKLSVLGNVGIRKGYLQLVSYLKPANSILKITLITQIATFIKPMHAGEKINDRYALDLKQLLH